MRLNSALLSLSLGFGCDAQSASSSAAASSAAASDASPAPSPTASASAPADPHVIQVTREQATAAGLPDIGMRMADVPDGWVASKKPGQGTYVSVGGPPGGVLMFVVRGYRADHDSEDQPEADIEKIYRAYLEEAGAIRTPFIAGKATEVTLAGAARRAAPFITGSGAARGNWCVVLVRSPRSAREGLMVLIGVSASEAATEPSCAASLDHPSLRPLIASLVVE